MWLSRSLIALSYAIDDSPRYRRVKGFCYDLLQNPRSKMRPWFDLCMMLLVLSTVAILIYEVKSDLGPFADHFERLAVGVFIVEYLARMWVYDDSHKIVLEHYERAEFTGTRFRLLPALGQVLGKKLEYARSPLAIVDLLAIIPSYRPLRFLRIFLLFRLFKLFRYARSMNAFAGILSDKRFELVNLLYLMAFLVFASASALYFFEAREPDSQIQNYFDAIYLAVVTVSTVGFGDITPQTTEGRMVTLVLIVSGLGMIAFFTSIIVSAFSERMDSIRAERILAELERHPGYDILCGFGRIGQLIAARLAADRERFLVVHPDPQRVAKAKTAGYLAIQGNAENTEFLQQLGVGQGAKRILCLTGNDVSNVYITLTARYLSPDIEIISRANHRRSRGKLLQAGASHALPPYEVVGMVAAEYVGQPVAFEGIYGMLAGDDQVSLVPVPLGPRVCSAHQRLGNIDFGRYKLLLFGVVSGAERDTGNRPVYDLRHQRFYFNPEPDFALHCNDVLLVFGHEVSVHHFRQQLERGSHPGRRP